MRLEEIPEAFVALERAGRFDYWGAPYASLTDEQRRERMPVRMLEVLWWDEAVEWDRTVADIVAFERDGLIRPGLVPFAGTGYGDHYCWYPRWQDGPGLPVVKFVHDELLSPLFARDFGEYLARCLLQHFAVEDDDAADDRPGRRERWRAHLEIVRPFLAEQLGATLDGLGSDVDAEACAAADAEIARQVGSRTLVGALQPTQYADDAIIELAGRDSLLAAYDRSVAFYEELVDAEGLAEYSAQLDQVRIAREAACRARQPGVS
jgi:hypothetical protein